jgi:hypothetical protein
MGKFFNYDLDVGDVIEVVENVPPVPNFHTALPKGNYGITYVTSGYIQFYNMAGRSQTWYDHIGNRKPELRKLDPSEKKAKEVLAVIAQAALTKKTSHVRTTGTDPEMFVQKSDGTLLPAFDFLTPKSPTTTLYYDGFAGEFTTAPRSCHVELVQQVRVRLMSLLEAAKKRDPGAKLFPKDVVDVSSFLETSKPEHLELGCSPSLNAYGETVLLPEGKQLPLRTSGLHVHLGISGLPPKSGDKLIQAVKAIDQFYGIISVSLLAGLEDPRRRLFYGRAGEYRLPSHGIEYRVPSGINLANPLLTYLTFDLVRFAACASLAGWLPYVWDVKEEEAQRIVNELDVEGARKVLKKNSKGLEAALLAIYPSIILAQTKDLILKGAEKHLVLDDPEYCWGFVPVKGYFILQVNSSRTTAGLRGWK